MNNNYLLECPDYLVLQKKIDRLILENNFSSASVNSYDMEEVSLECALEDLDTYGFLSEKKVIIIFSIECLNPIENQKDLMHLYDYLEHPLSSNLLIICAKKLNSTLKFTKDLKKKLAYFLVQADAKSFVLEELKDYSLEQGVVSLLLELCKNDLSRLFQECCKLKDYCIDEKKITKQDVSSLVVEKIEDDPDLTFAFVKSLASKDKKDALLKYQDLLLHQTAPYSILGLLASQFRIMYQVKVLERRNYSNDLIAQTLGQKPYRIRKTRELTRFYSEKELLQFMISLADIDFQIKTSDVDPDFLIQQFILSL